MTTYQGVLEALGDQRRQQILALLQQSPASVGELADRLPISRPAVSQHLGVLQAQSLVSHRPAGTRNVYRLEPVGFVVLREWLDDVWSVAFDRFADFAEREGEAGERGD